jgi:heat shock protein 90kDa beta
LAPSVLAFTAGMIDRFGTLYSPAYPNHSFLVADKVYVASVPPASSSDPNPTQHIFSSSADESEFEVFPDPRGNTLGRGTEITLVLKDDALEYLDTTRLAELM